MQDYEILAQRIAELKQKSINCEMDVKGEKIFLSIQHQEMANLRSKVEFSKYEWGPLDSVDKALEAIEQAEHEITSDFTILFLGISTQYEQAFCK